MNIIDTAYQTTSNAKVFIEPASGIPGAVDPGVEEIKHCIRLGAATIHSRVVNITPQIASYLLSINPNNRTISGRFERTMRYDMEAGRFNGLNGQTIVISRDGLLNDGQTRLTAIKNANVSIPVMVVFGVERDSRMTVDQGRARTTGEFAKMAGLCKDAAVAAAAKLVMAYDRGLLTHKLMAGFKNNAKAAPTNSEIISFMEENIDFLNAATSKVYSIQAVERVIKRSNFIALHVILSRAADDGEIVNAFFDRLADGASLSETSPILHLRNRLIEYRQDKMTNFAVTASVVIKCWNAWRTGVEMKRLRVDPSEIQGVVK